MFGTDKYRGWLSEIFLNYYGIDIEKENKGIYAGKTVTEGLLSLKKFILHC